MAKIAVFAGTRPEFIKLAAIIWQIIENNEDLLFVHTGQHYDYNMSLQFIDELSLPKPKYSLDVGSSTPGAQTASILERAENVLKCENPDFVLVEGDTNSVLGVALASAKLRIRLGHVEAGCRSFDRSMPEELNRVVVADCATLNFAPTKKCVDNLLHEGVNPTSIHLTGHPIVDAINKLKRKIGSSKVLDNLGLTNEKYALLTVHREENADNKERLKNILQAVKDIDVEVVFPIHPRTKKNMRTHSIRLGSNVIATAPLGYFDILNLIKEARAVITDSGGIQQEACILQTPCITIRDRTEWTETVDAGLNVLCGTDRKRIVAAYKMIMRNYDDFKRRFKLTGSMFGNGDAADRILRILSSSISESTT
jgi:UDP-N-acetylglucosamine 2-epimerase (non-hydrolysing)